MVMVFLGSGNNNQSFLFSKLELFVRVVQDYADKCLVHRFFFENGEILLSW